MHHFELFNDALTSLVDFSKDRVANALPSDTSFNSSTLVKSESTLLIEKSSSVEAIARPKSEDLVSPSTPELFSQPTMNESTMTESPEPVLHSSPHFDDHPYARMTSMRKRDQLSSSQIDEEEEDCARKRAAIARPVEEEKKESIAREKSALVCRKCGACIAKGRFIVLEDIFFNQALFFYR